MIKPDKIFECSCADGFTGDFCEFKTAQDHLLFVYEKRRRVFNADGRLIEKNAINDEHVKIDGTCSTMMNGESIIIGGYGKFKRQVHL